MIKYFYFFLLILICSCTKDEGDFIEANLKTNFFIPAGLNTVESHYFVVDDVDLFLDQVLTSNQLPTNEKYKITGSKAKLTTAFSDFDFSVINRISIFAINPENNLDRIEIFYNEEIPFNTQRELKLLAALGDFSKYIKNNKIDLQVRIQFKGLTSFQSNVDVDFNYLIYKN